MAPTSAGIVIKVPPEAVAPILIGAVALVILIFAGAALEDWKRRQPRAASIVGTVIAAVLTAYAAWVAIRIVPAHYIDHGAPGETTIGFLDGPICGFTALIATLFWRFAERRTIAIAVGAAFGLVLFVKPFVVPLHAWHEGVEHAWHFADPEHLSFHGPGLAVLIATFFVAQRKRRVR